MIYKILERGNEKKKEEEEDEEEEEDATKMMLESIQFFFMHSYCFDLNAGDVVNEEMEMEMEMEMVLAGL